MKKKSYKELRRALNTSSGKKVAEELLNSYCKLQDLLTALANSHGYERRKILKEIEKLYGKKVAIPAPEKDAKEDHQENPENTPRKDCNRNRRSSGDISPSKRHRHAHPTLKQGDVCPKCSKGKLYPLKDEVLFVIVGAPPLSYEAHHRERLRCNACQQIFKAPLPEDFPKQSRASPSGIASAILLHYQMGIPFHRLARYQEQIDQRLTLDQLWDLCKEGYESVLPVYRELESVAGEAMLYHVDDTSVRILTLIKENKKNRKKPRKQGGKKNPEDRVSMYTTAIIAKDTLEREVHLFYHGRRHAGENFDALIKKRNSGEIPLHMADALSCNVPQSLKVLSCNCLAHAIRKFKSTINVYPKESLEVLDAFGEVYENEKHCTKEQLSKKDRLRYHKKKSGPTLKNLRSHMESLISDRHVEPNSSLGEAIRYSLKYWDKLTGFLKFFGAPLDNNDAERTLKASIILRKNSLFFKTEKGAFIGGVLQSLIETARHARVNIYDYLSQLVKHREDVKGNPSEWLPWNYLEKLSDIEQA